MKKLSNWLKEYLLFVLVGFILFFVPLYPKFPLYFVSEANVAVRLEDFLVAGVILVWLIITCRKKRIKETLQRPLTQLFILYFSVGFLSLVSALLITQNISLKVAFLHFLRRVEYFLLFFVAYDSLKKPVEKQIKGYAGVLAVSVLGVLVYALGQKFYGWPVVSTMNREFAQGTFLRLSVWARVNSTFAGHYDLAAFLAMTLVLIATFLVLTKKIIFKFLIFLFWLLAFYVLILTSSRISFPAYLIAIIVLFVWLKTYWYIPFFVVLSLTGMLLSQDFSQRYISTFKISSQYLSYFSGMVKVKPKPAKPTAVPTAAPTVFVTPVPVTITPTITPRPTITPTATPTIYEETPVEATDLAVSRSTDIRLKVEWPRALMAFAKNPFLGTGYSSITLATDNDYLRILGETGLLGALSLFLLFAAIFLKGLNYVNKAKSAFSRTVVVGMICASLAYFLNATFIDVFEASKLAFIFWIMMGVLVKITDLAEEGE